MVMFLSLLIPICIRYSFCVPDCLDAGGCLGVAEEISIDDGMARGDSFRRK
jgi:hypothetical protein